MRNVTLPRPDTATPTPAFKIGMVVQLASSREPFMTIDARRKDGRLVCVWFDHRGRFHRAVFNAAALQALGA